LDRLQQILLFKELEFPLKEIKRIIDAPNFDKNRALEQQIELLSLKKEHLENLIAFAQSIQLAGGKKMDFKAFDTKKMDEYAKRAKAQWGETDAYKEFETKSEGRTKADENSIAQDFMSLFAEMGTLKHLDPADAQVQLQLEKIQAYITTHFYTCTKEIFSSLGEMYGCGGEFTENINKVSGVGTAEFTSKAIKIYCQ
jgi:DNA-binding transcriptional MerR regulator